MLFDLYPHRKKDGFEKLVKQTIQKKGWDQFNEYANFLKHADNDPHDEIAWFHEMDTLLGLGIAIVLYKRLARKLTPEMAALDFWMRAMNPDVFQLPAGFDLEVDANFRKSLDYLKTASHAKKLKLGKFLIKLFRKHAEKLVI